MFISKKRIFADDEIDMDMDVDMEEVDQGGVNVAPEATDLLFEAEDVAELVAEISGQPVEVSADGDQVVFAVGEDEFTVSAEGDEEILEAVRRPFKKKRPIAASMRRPIAASTRRASNNKLVNRPAPKTIRKLPTRSK